MIASFKDDTLSSFYFDGPNRKTRRIPADTQKVLRRKLDQLFSAEILTDLRVPPSNRLEQLKGNRQGFYSIRVNDQYRLVFRWHENAAYDVEFVDYH